MRALIRRVQEAMQTARVGGFCATPLTRTLTLKQLINARACESQRQMFFERFGKSVEVTPELCRANLDFNYQWAANSLLSRKALEAYRTAIAPAYQAYRTALAFPRETAFASEWRAYFARRASADKEYDTEIASAWAEAYISDI